MPSPTDQSSVEIAPAEPDTAPVEEAETLVADELIVEDVSIDGMCGVY
jgi:mycofactocin precursor